MSEVKLMNRVDMKFVTTEDKLRQLLEIAANDYCAQEVDGQRIASYYTVYFDTDDCEMFRKHQAGHMPRQKLRIRSYVDSHLHFLEVKTKDNHGRTKKKRTKLPDFEPGMPPKMASDLNCGEFLSKHLRYDATKLHSHLENRFCRITLVNKAKTERLTIDFGLQFHNVDTDCRKSLDGLVIIELKRDGRMPSPILPLLRQLRIKPQGFSKYCMGSAMTNDGLRVNRFKPRLRKVEKIRQSAR